MATLETIRRLTIQGRTTGVAEATQALTALDRAQTKVAQTAEGVAVATDNSAKRQVSVARQYDNVRAKVDDAFRSQRQFQRDQAVVNRAFQQGSIGAEEHANTIALLTQRYGANSVAANENVKQTGLARHELVNLGRQAQDVGTMLAMGQSPLMILSSQGAQVFDIFSSSEGTMRGFFDQMKSGLVSIVTPARLAFGGIIAGAAAAAFAVNSYLSTQQRVQMQLFGAGRASGATLGSINATAQAGSSAFGLSVSEARDFAATLASTGKIANENILPIVQMGKDIAHVFGVDAADAAKMLSQAFSDPAKGAEELNQRLGFMDAAMKRNIQNMVDQGRAYDAQRALATSLKSSLEDVSGAVSKSTNFWTAFGNTISNAWDKVGEFLAKQSGLAQSDATERLKEAETAITRLEEMRSRMSRGQDQSGINAALDREIQKRDQATLALQRYDAAVTTARQNQRSFAQDAAVRAQLPEIDRLQRLRNEQEMLVKAMIDVQTTGGPASEILQRMGRSYDELAKAIQIVNEGLKAFKTDFQSNVESLNIAGDALTAFSPGARGEIARRQSLASTANSALTGLEREALAAKAAENAIRSMTVAMSEARRERELYARQNVEQAQLEIALLGKTIGQQTEMRANLQVRQQLEQEAARNRTAFDTAEFERLKQINAELGKRQQMLARAQLNSQIKFDRQTATLSQDDVAIAQQLSGVYPDVATALASAEAEAIRFNAAIRDISTSIESNLSNGLVDMLSGTKSVSDGFRDMANSIIRDIERMIVKMMIIRPLMGGLQGVIGGIIPGVGGGATMGFDGLTAIHHGGYGPGDAIQRRYVHPAYFDDAPRFHSGIGPGERPAIIRDDESVLTPGQMRQLAPAGQPRQAPPSIEVNVINQSSGTTAETRPNASGGVDVLIRDAVRNVMTEDAASNGPISKTMMARSTGFGGR